MIVNNIKFVLEELKELHNLKFETHLQDVGNIDVVRFDDLNLNQWIKVLEEVLNNEE